MVPHMSREEILWSTEGFDRFGRSSGIQQFIGHSFLTQYYGIIQTFMTGNYAANTEATNTITDTTGTGRSFEGGQNMPPGTRFATQNAVPDATYGIQVGTGTTANSGSTSSLATLIAHGNGAGQLSYGTMSITNPGGTAPLFFTFSRTFTNNSGADIGVAEIGLAVAADTGGTQRNYLIIRDVLGSTVTVTNGGFRTFTGTMQYTIA